MLIAAPSKVDPPEWLINAAARWHAKVTLLVPGSDEDDHVERIAKLTEGTGVECGFVTVPEDHGDPGGPTIRIAVALFQDGKYVPQPRCEKDTGRTLSRTHEGWDRAEPNSRPDAAR